MTWGCKAENHPNGCGWASSAAFPSLDLIQWWCDTCERSGEVSTKPGGLESER